MAVSERAKTEERRLYIEETRVHSELFLSSGSIYDIIDELVSQYINEDRLFNPYKLNEYLSEEEQQRIIKTVSTNIIEEMSPILYNQLACYFNKDKITEIITRRVIMAVIGLTAHINNNAKMENISLDDDYTNRLNNMLSNIM